jgi:ribosome-binding protein aMBF1 (putative translation factor)
MATRKYSDLRAKMTPEARTRVDARVLATLQQLPLLELRKARSLSQEQLAKELQTTQGEISKIEHRTDMYLSTLRNYVEALGGELDIIARFKDGAVRISTFEGVGNAEHHNA